MSLHVAVGHVGVRKLTNEVKRRYNIPPSVSLSNIVSRVRRSCLTCQACVPPNWSTELPITCNPVPEKIMTSVALDIFSLPPVKWEGKGYDSLLLCVDCMSGWIIARPCNKVGLTAESSARLMLDNAWETFGIPSIITSFQGPQFSGQWWKTMCARLGKYMPIVRHTVHRPMAELKWLAKPYKFTHKIA